MHWLDGGGVGTFPKGPVGGSQVAAAASRGSTLSMAGGVYGLRFTILSLPLSLEPVGCEWMLFLIVIFILSIVAVINADNPGASG